MVVWSVIWPPCLLTHAAEIWPLALQSGLMLVIGQQREICRQSINKETGHVVGRGGVNAEEASVLRFVTVL